MTTIDLTQAIQEAEAANPTTYTVFGRFSIEEAGKYGKLGKSKETYDPARHERWHLWARLVVRDMRNGNRVERGVIFGLTKWDGHKEWRDVIRPSLQALNIPNASLSVLDGCWVAAELVPTGGTWTDDEGKQREQTTFKFVRVFADEAECIAAFEQAKKSPATSQATHNAVQPISEADLVNVSTPAGEAAISSETLDSLVKSLWGMAGQNRGKFEGMLNTNLSTIGLNAQSPAVVAAIERVIEGIPF